jgi:hypothetical protein
MNIIDLYEDNPFEPGADGYIIKAGQGGLEYDWRSHAARAVEAGKPYGLYWVVDARYSPEYHKAAIKSAFPAGYFGDLGFWLDLEAPRLGMTDAEYNQLPYRGYRTVESVWRGVGAYAAFPGIYTSPHYWQLIMSAAPATLQAELAQRVPLWLAHWGVASPTIVGAWREWALWQWRGEPDYNRVNPAWWQSVSTTSAGEPFMIVRDRAYYSIELTPSLFDVLPYRTPEEHAELLHAQAAINFGAGFQETDADHARVFGRSVSLGIQYSNNGDWGYIELDAGTVIPFARRMLDQGAINPELDDVYKSPWTMLGFDDRRQYMIVSPGQEDRAGLTQRGAALWCQARGIRDLYLGDSGHSSWILEYGQLLYSAYGERTPQAIGFIAKTSGGSMKARNAGTIDLNIKNKVSGLVLNHLKMNDYVFGELSQAGTDIIDFDHFYRATGERVELGAMCKVTRSTAIVITNEIEPGSEPQEPPAGAVPHMRQTLTDSAGVTWLFECDGVRQP